MSRKDQSGSHTAVWADAVTEFPDLVKERAEKYQSEVSSDILSQVEVAFTTKLGEIKFEERKQKISEWGSLHDTYLTQVAEINALNTILKNVEKHIEQQNPDYAAKKKWCVEKRDYLRSRHIHASGIPVDGVPQTHPLFREVIDLESDLSLCVEAGKAVVQEQLDIAIEVGGDALEYARLCQDEHDKKRGKKVKERESTISGLLGLTERKE